MAEPVAQAPAITASAAATAADAAPQIDMENVTLDQLDTLMTTGKSELPLKSGGEETGQDEPPPAKNDEVTAGDKPPETEAKKGEEEVEGESEETRTAEEIEAAQAEARAAIVEAGGTDEEQEAAAAEAAKPKAEAESGAAKTEEELDELPSRFRLKDPMARAAMAVYKAAEASGKPISLAEAEKRVRGEEPAAEQIAEVEAVDHEAIVGTLEGEVTALKTELTALNDETDQSLYKKRIAEITVELGDKSADLKLAKRDLKQATEAAKIEAEAERIASREARTASKAEAITDYPEAGREGSALDLAIKAEIATLQNPKHPDHTLLYADSAPYVIASRVAKKLGIAPVAKKAASPPVKPKVEAPPKSKLSPASGAKSSVQPGAISEEAIAKKTVEYLRSDQATLQDLDAAMGDGDPGATLAALVR